MLSVAHSEASETSSVALKGKALVIQCKIMYVFVCDFLLWVAS